MKFDPDAAAQPGSGVFGLPFTREEARILLIPAPFDATTSYGGGTAEGPEAIRAASAQVDLFDHQFGRVYEAGMHMVDAPAHIRDLSRTARALAEPIIARGGATPEDAEALSAIENACRQMHEYVYTAAARAIADGKIPGLVGGDHSTPLGAMRACAEAAGARGWGILQIDAHMDLRESFEGFRYSHASIMWNALAELPGITRLVQVGIRDYGEGERHISESSGGQIVTHYDLDWVRRMDSGEQWIALCAQAVSVLPELVYVSLDIDGLDPALCPNTGTPMPGGLNFAQVSLLLETLARSGRRIIGFDLNEVCPAPGGDNEWDANVGARVLYKLCGAAAVSNGLL